MKVSRKLDWVFQVTEMISLSAVTIAGHHVETPKEVPMKTDVRAGGSASKKIWIDLDNSPHVPFFIPIIKELEGRGYSVTLTARDAYQVSELVDLFGLKCRKIGRHLGKNKFLKVFGVCLRTLRLIPHVLREKPDLALSHGSRAQLLVSSLLRIPNIVIFDYEYAQGLLWFHTDWVIVPDIIPDHAIKLRKERILRYRGIKEDVYVPSFKPDPALRRKLGLSEEDIVVTIRPPANEAHYHKPESDELFSAAVTYLAEQPGVRMILLPRNARQEAAVRELWPNLLSSGKMIIPEHVVDGLNLIWFSDLVVSGGGTMNREAAALGVPVYSIFRGKIGAVDQYLAEQGRLVLLTTAEDVKNKLQLTRRHVQAGPDGADRFALHDIVDEVTAVLNLDVSARH